QPLFGGLTYNQALDIDQNAGVNGIDAALSQFHLDAVVAPTDSPGWTTDLILSDHFIFASSGLAGGAGLPLIPLTPGRGLRVGRAIPSYRYPRAARSGCRWASAFLGPPSASRR